MGSGDVTRALEELAGGDQRAAVKLLPLLYDDLRAAARRQFRGQPANHTLQPTILVHEAFLRLAGSGSPFSSRVHFCAVAATAMRQILVDHARARNADKRGSGRKAVLLDHDGIGDPLGNPSDAALDVLWLDDALTELERIDARKRQIVELRFFAGLTVPEVAQVMGISVSTVEAEWRAARAWLAVELGR